MFDQGKKVFEAINSSNSIGMFDIVVSKIIVSIATRLTFDGIKVSKWVVKDDENDYNTTKTNGFYKLTKKEVKNLLNPDF